MSAMQVEVFEAFRNLNARLEELGRNLIILKWMVAIALSMVATLLLRSFTH